MPDVLYEARVEHQQHLDTLIGGGVDVRVLRRRGGGFASTGLSFPCARVLCSDALFRAGESTTDLYEYLFPLGTGRSWTAWGTGIRRRGDGFVLEVLRQDGRRAGIQARLTPATSDIDRSDADVWHRRLFPQVYSEEEGR